jgi:hypothetical protein
MRPSMFAVPFFILVGVPFAAAQPRACFGADGGGRVPRLQDSDQPKVLMRNVDIEDRTTHSIARVKTFSETDPSGNGRLEQCFRSEVENTGAVTIINYWWFLPTINVDPFKPTQWRSKVYKQDVTDDPIEINSQMAGFENTEVYTRAYADRTTRNIPPSGTRGGSMQPEFSTMLARNVDPRLPQLLASHNLSSDSPLPVYLFKEDGKTPENTVSYSAPDFKLDVSSSAQRSGNVLKFFTSVRVQGEAASTASFAMPALASLEVTKAQPDQFNFSREFVERYESNKQITFKGQAGWKFTSEVPITSSVARAFRITHPIEIRHGATRDCTLVTSFSPVPVSFPFTECKMIGQR